MVVNASCPQTFADAYASCVVWHADYDEYGRRNGPLVKGDENLHSFGFAGGLFDYETGLTRFGARDYDAQLGRWTARDPVMFLGAQANLYAYVSGDPINNLDPRGLWTVGFGQQASTGAGTSSSIAWQLTFDSNGGADLQVTTGVGGGGGASLSVVNLQVTSAKSVDELTGWSLEFSAPTPVPGLSAAYLQGSTYKGFEIGAGGLEGHAIATHTWSLRNWLDNLKN